MRIRSYKNNIKRFSLMRDFGLFSQSQPLNFMSYSIVGDDNQLLATHMKITSLCKRNNVGHIFDLLKQYPNCHVTIMSPAVKRDRQDTTGAMIQPGHIHSTCNDFNGNIMPDGDASFTIDNSKKKETRRSVPDSRLTGYQSELIPVGQCRFSSTVEEVEKWDKVSSFHSGYPLYALAIPFKSEEERDAYLMLVKKNKELYKHNIYSLFTHYHKQTFEVVRANNCVTFNSMMNEDFFNKYIYLGDNPSPQLAYIKLLNVLFSDRMQFIQQNIIDNFLFDNEHYQSDFHVFGVV